MFVFIATIAASVFAADPGAGPRDIYARLGEPKMETCDYRIHVGEDGKWTQGPSGIGSLPACLTTKSTSCREFRSA